MSRSNAFLFLYGPSGSGKSMLAGRIAGRLELPVYDLDRLIEAGHGCSVAEIFAQHGEAAFRAAESAALSRVLDSAPGVVSLGGGALLDAQNRVQVEQAGRILCLHADSQALAARLDASDEVRPLVNAAGLEALLQTRAEHYASFPVRLDTTRLSPDQALDSALSGLGAWRISGMGNPYPVRVVPGGLDLAGARLAELGLAGPVALVSDVHVDALYGQRVQTSLEGQGYRVVRIRIAAGEEHKTLAAVETIWAQLVEAGLERGSTLAALGGGITGDLAGFAAATYLRGVHWVGLPTSLLAMVDSSLGGKTGVDLPQGKNLIGAFHSPALVLSDPLTLETLPPVELRSGLAEAVKHGVIGDARLFEMCGRGPDALRADWDGLVRRAVAVKIRVIEADPYERGLRETLNLGHTIGHGVEKASQYRLRHGEAVAIGMAAEARLAERLGLAEKGLAAQIEAVLSRLDLPVHIPAQVEQAAVLHALRVDKKRSQGQVRFSLPLKIGEVQAGVVVDLNEAMLKEIA